MIPRTVLMAQEVASILSSSELQEYGNIILNGYATTGPNSTGKLGWAWPDSPLAPATPLPSVTTVSPALKGWSTNYMAYYTRPGNPDYNVYPGAPTMFEYTVHSFGNVATGGIKTLGGNGTWITGGQNYTPGTYAGIPLTGGSGAGAVGTIVVTDPAGAGGPVTGFTQTVLGAGYPAGTSITDQDTYAVTGNGFGCTVDGGTGFVAPFEFNVFSINQGGFGYQTGDILAIPGGVLDAEIVVSSVSIDGKVISVTVTNPGTGYKKGEAVSAVIPGGGTGFYAPISAISNSDNASSASWARPPRRFFQNQVAPFTPPATNQQAIPYSFMYPVDDLDVPPPIDYVEP